jgi:uncharacterized alkaline shock family protein YloU
MLPKRDIIGANEEGVIYMADEKANSIQVLTNPNGKINFASDVVAIIAGLAATEIKGVAGMSGGVAGGIAEMLGRKNLTKGVKVEVGEEETAVDLFIIIDYGVKIHEVCMKMQETVKKAIENMTGLRVIEVNIYVQGVVVERDKKPVAVAEEPPAGRVK